MASRKLTPGEISSTVEKIRRKYDEYISKYFKPKALREAFESRYIDSLRAGVDVSSFLIAEISAIDELIVREEERIMRAPPRRSAKPAESYADKVLEENRKRIAKYPDLHFHGDVREELRRLVGALSDLARDRWPSLGSALGDTMYAMSSSEMIALDSQLRSLASSKKVEAPQSLTRLMNHLGKFPRNYPAIDREEKEYILEAAFFLHDLLVVMERVKEVYPELTADKRRIVEDIATHVGSIINDFRLKDLKRKRRWDRAES